MKKNYILSLSLLACNVYATKDKDNVPIQACQKIYDENKTTSYGFVDTDKWNKAKPNFFKCLANGLVQQVKDNQPTTVSDYMMEHYLKDKENLDAWTNSLKTILINELSQLIANNENTKKDRILGYFAYLPPVIFKQIKIEAETKANETITQSQSKDIDKVKGDVRNLLNTQMQTTILTGDLEDPISQIDSNTKKQFFKCLEENKYKSDNYCFQSYDTRMQSLLTPLKRFFTEAKERSKDYDRCIFDRKPEDKCQADHIGQTQHEKDAFNLYREIKK